MLSWVRILVIGGSGVHRLSGDFGLIPSCAKTRSGETVWKDQALRLGTPA